MPEKLGKYEVIERIGRGGMGMIFKAHDPVLDRPVALKVISSEIEVTDELRAYWTERFPREEIVGLAETIFGGRSPLAILASAPKEEET